MKLQKPLATAALAAAMLWAPSAQAHCDTLDGPVVAAGKAALDAGNVNLALAWVRPGDEQEIRAAFAKAAAVRSTGAAARDLADLYFFETLVRVHRAGENAPYTGLKPPGRIEPPVAAADKAIATGRLQGLHRLVGEQAEKALHQQFEQVLARRRYDANDVQAGRAYTAAYVEFMHLAERLYGAAQPQGHEPAAAQGGTTHRH